MDGDEKENLWSEVVSRGKKKKNKNNNKNLLVVKASDNGSATDKKNQVREALSDVQIQDSKFTAGGNIIMNFETETVRDKASEKLKHVENVNVTQVKRLLPKIMICNVHKEEDKSKIVDLLIEWNEYLQTIDNIKDKISIVFSKPAAGETVHYIMKCNPEVRAIIHYHHDKLKLQWGVYDVRDRYHALMCYYCLKYGHKKDKCSAMTMGDNPVCYKCAGNHEGYNCHETIRKCINCVKAKRQNDHSVSSTYCPFFAAELQRIRNNTDHGF